MPVPTTPKKAQNRYYFDRNYLLQYINQKVKTKVFVDGRFLDVADASDLEDELHGVGYDNSGNPKFFDYRSVEQVKAGSNLITLDQLQQLQTQKTTPEQEPEGEEPEPPEGGEEEPPSEEPEDMGGEEEPEPPEGEEEEEPAAGKKPPKEPIKAHYDPFMIGRNIINESMKKKNPKKEVNALVRILERPYYNVTGMITEVYDNEYEVKTFSGHLGRVTIRKENVKFI
jgi:hypothetical protein